VVAVSDGTEYVGQSTNNFVYDGWNLIGILNPASSLVESFTWGNDLSGSAQGAGGVGGLLTVSYHGNATTNCFVAYDGNGNVAALVNAADGTLAANYEYGPFGEVIRQTGPMVRANPFRFSTKYDDDETDLLYYGYRFYKASTGTWLTRDPIEEHGGKNLYGFVKENPLSFVDLTGLAYSYSEASPTGAWAIKYTPNLGNFNMMGFTTKYSPISVAKGCQCGQKDMFISQAVHDPLGHPIGFDVVPFDFSHKADDPIPGYLSPYVPPQLGVLSIDDAPHFSDEYWPGTWEFEDCAVCRSASNGSTADQVIGCIKFTFKRDSQKGGEIFVTANGKTTKLDTAALVLAEKPGKLWEEAYKNWKTTGN